LFPRDLSRYSCCGSRGQSRGAVRLAVAALVVEFRPSAGLAEVVARVRLHHLLYPNPHTTSTTSRVSSTPTTTPTPPTLATAAMHTYAAPHCPPVQSALAEMWSGWPTYQAQHDTNLPDGSSGCSSPDEDMSEWGEDDFSADASPDEDERTGEEGWPGEDPFGTGASPSEGEATGMHEWRGEHRHSEDEEADEEGREDGDSHDEEADGESGEDGDSVDEGTNESDFDSLSDEDSHSIDGDNGMTLADRWAQWAADSGPDTPRAANSTKASTLTAAAESVTEDWPTKAGPETISKPLIIHLRFRQLQQPEAAGDCRPDYTLTARSGITFHEVRTMARRYLQIPIRPNKQPIIFARVLSWEKDFAMRGGTRYASTLGCSQPMRRIEGGENGWRAFLDEVRQELSDRRRRNMRWPWYKGEGSEEPVIEVTGHSG